MCVFNLSQLVGGPIAVKTYGKSEQQFYFLLPGCVVSVIFGTKRRFSPNADP